MSKEKSDPKAMAAELVKYLRGLRNDRGAMADLRRALSPAQRHRAWPLLARFGRIGDVRYETVAGLFAYHPDGTSSGNLGAICRRLSGDHNTFEGRFKRMLACDRKDICNHIRPVVLAAKAKGIGVNYEQLFVDLHYWGSATKVRWADSFWGSTEAADAESLVDAEATR